METEIRTLDNHRDRSIKSWAPVSYSWNASEQPTEYDRPNPNLMPKLPRCQTCQFNSRSQYITCAIHPEGPKSDRCLYYRPDPASESWAPTGYAWYGKALIASSDRLTECDRLELLESHPLFTGPCPQCDRECGEPLKPDWGCAGCGWQGDSV